MRGRAEAIDFELERIEPSPGSALINGAFRAPATLSLAPRVGPTEAPF